MVAVLAVVGCDPKNAEKPKIVPNNSYAKAAMGKAIRQAAEKPTGTLTAADIEKVTKLVLANSKITDVSALASYPKLEWLHLSNNQLTDVSALGGLTQLKRLILDHNQLTDVSVLLALKQMVFIDLSDNPNLTKAEVDRLKTALPNCTIEHNAK